MSSRTVDAAAWSALLTRELKCPVDARFGRSRTVPIRVRADASGRGLRIGLHVMFADAPGDVRDALPRWIRSGKRAKRAAQLLDDWIHAQLEALPPRRVSRRRVQPVGDVYDLTEMARPLFEQEFAGEFSGSSGRPRPALTWGRRGKSQTRGALRLGSYDPELNLVRIHRVMDQEGVPAWFVRYVVFHEILHAAVPREPGRDGRILHHGPRFKRREKTYPDYPRALEWEARHLRRLIQSARHGTAFRAPARTRVAARNVTRRVTRSAASTWVQRTLFPS